MDGKIKSVVWSKRSTKDLEKIKSFYSDLYGKSITRKILTEIRQSTEVLEHQYVDTSKIGSIDETFSHLKYEYRKIIHRNCKITYREGVNNFYIVRVFDTRQSPHKNK